MNIAILAFLAANTMRPGGDMRDVSMRPPLDVARVTIAAMPFTRTVTCSTYTLTGTSTGSGAVSWSASPSGASGACTGTDSWSCVVDVDPDAVGEGVEVVTVTRGTATDTETIGFYVDGEHSCWLAQSINGTYNSGMVNADAVATWTNLGSSALNVTQGTGSAQPSYRTAVVGGQPVVRCDGGDDLTASTAADWTFLNDGTDWSVEFIKKQTAAFSQHIVSTRANSGLAFGVIMGDINTQNMQSLVSNSATNVSAFQATNTDTISVFHNAMHVLDDDGGAGVDLTNYLNGTSVATGSRTGSYSSTAPGTGVRICAAGGGAAAFWFGGDLFRVHIYQSALSSTQRGINKAVDEWALGGTLPVTP